MDKNLSYIKSIAVQDIPWQRLATVYGRATYFSACFEKLAGESLGDFNEAGEHIAINIEHQSTFWPATPFAMIFLTRIFADSIGRIEESELYRYKTEAFLDLFIQIAEAIQLGDDLKHDPPLLRFEDMLNEDYLWSEEYDELEDEARYAEDGGPFSDSLFYSFYYYSKFVLLSFKQILKQLAEVNNRKISTRATALLTLLKV